MTILNPKAGLLSAAAALVFATGLEAAAAPADPAMQAQMQNEQILMTEVQLAPGAAPQAAEDARAVISAMDLTSADALGDIEAKLVNAGVDAKVYTFAMSMESAAVLNGAVEPIVVDRPNAAASKIIVSKAPASN